MTHPAWDIKHAGQAGDAGLQAYKDYLKSGKMEQHTIMPGASWDLQQGVMRVEKNRKGDIVSGDQVSSSLSLISTDGPLKATTTATTLDFDQDKDSLEIASLESSADSPAKPALKFRGSGRYQHSDLHSVGIIPMSGKIYQLEIGPQSEAGGVSYDGEYGREKRYSLVVGNDAVPGQRLSILAWAGGRDPVGIRTAGEGGRVMRLVGKPDHHDQVGVVFEGEVRAGQIIDFTQMVQGGAATPVRFIIIPTSARPTEKSNGG